MMLPKVLKLNNGLNIPTVGLGTFLSKFGEAEEAVKTAIVAGYRHIDTAWFYHNEEAIGNGIRAKIDDGTVKREELFITTKLWNNFHEKSLVVPKMKESLKALQLEYVDLFLIHWPMGWKILADTWPACNISDKSDYSDVDYLETWQGMEECVTSGLAKSIGVSNFNSEQIDRLLQNCKIKPVINQVEANVKINQKKLIQFCKEREILIAAYHALYKGNGELFDDPQFLGIGKKYNKDSAQVILNYLVSLGMIVIPKSTTNRQIISNIDIFDFNLDSADLEFLDSLNDNTRILDITFFSDHKYFPFGIDY